MSNRERNIPAKVRRRFEYAYEHGKIMLNSLLPANPNGNIGCGTVYVNFSEEPTEIKPISKAQTLFNICGKSPGAHQKTDQDILGCQQ